MTKPQGQQQGMALVEALIASAILGIGLVGATQLTLKTLHTASQNRQHTVAQQLAEEAMDCLRATAFMPAQAGADPCPGPQMVQIRGVPYTLQAQSVSGAAGHWRDLSVRVRWPDPPTGPENLLEWHSSVSLMPSWVGVSLP